MWLVHLHKLALLACTCGLSAAQSQQAFQNFSPAQDSGRGRAAPSVPQARPTSNQRVREEQRETTTPVPILKQINEHNEDGSYTYGYEAADGTFKLETRFKDGSVQGKYGYVDVNGEVKIIEYGANAMGFQPQGDLPDGIIIPPPVEGNCTDCDYDYDYETTDLRANLLSEEDSNLVVQNRARGGNNGGAPPLNTQNRGQVLREPITQPPQPRRQQQQQQQPTFSSFSARQPEAAPQQQSFPTFTARDPAAGVPQRKSSPIRIAPPAPKSAPAQPAFRPTPKSTDFRPTRPAPPPTVAAVRKLPEPRPSSESSRGGSGSEFSNFPARDNQSRTRSRPSRPAAAPAAPASSRPSQRFQAVPANPEPQLPPASVPETPRQASNPARGRQRVNATPSRSQASQAAPQPQAFPAAPQAPAFRPPPQQQQPAQAFPPQQQQQAFPPQQNVFQSGSLRPAFEDVRPGSSGQSQASFNAFPAVNTAPGPGFNRPALTFQEPATNAVPGNLPKSALEIVDFNQLVQEFQGSLRPQATNTFSQNNAAVFSNPQNTQTRFSTNNFPVRF